MVRSARAARKAELKKVAVSALKALRKARKKIHDANAALFIARESAAILKEAFNRRRNELFAEFPDTDLNGDESNDDEEDSNP
jgi:site-specific recombinase XerC